MDLITERCMTCRTDPDWRERVTGVREFDCPHGITASQAKDGLPARPHARPPQPIKMPEGRVIRLAIARAAACTTCEHLNPKSGVRLTRPSGRGFEPIFRAACKLCSSCGGGVSLIHGAEKCKAGKWDGLEPAHLEDPNSSLRSAPADDKVVSPTQE